MLVFGFANAPVSKCDLRNSMIRNGLKTNTPPSARVCPPSRLAPSKEAANRERVVSFPRVSTASISVLMPPPQPSTSSGAASQPSPPSRYCGHDYYHYKHERIRQSVPKCEGSSHTPTLKTTQNAPRLSQLRDHNANLRVNDVLRRQRQALELLEHRQVRVLALSTVLLLQHAVHVHERLHAVHVGFCRHTHPVQSCQCHSFHQLPCRLQHQIR